jgi:hypothetical protein
MSDKVCDEYNEINLLLEKIWNICVLATIVAINTFGSLNN